MNFFKNLFFKNKNISEKESELKQDLTNNLLIPIIKETNPLVLSAQEISQMINELAKDYFLGAKSGYFFDPNNRDPLFEDAAKLIVQSQSGSTSLLQRRMKLGYNRTGRIMDQLEAAGVVGPNQGSKVRDVLLTNAEELQKCLNAELLPFANPSRMKMKSFYEEHKAEIEQRVIELQQEEINENIAKEKEKIRLALLEKQRVRNLQKQTMQELKDDGLINTHKEKRTPIPQEVMDSVWNRDEGKCVKCGSNYNLEFDHIIPFSKGGANTYRNLQLLCEKCNIEKSNKIG